MRKILLTVMCIMSLCLFSACGGAQSEKYELGDTVSTDIVDFKLEKADFAIACENTVNENYLLPRSYNPSTDTKNPFVAPVGKTIVAMTFTVKNNNRTSIHFGSAFGDWDLYWKVRYKGSKYSLHDNDTDALYLDFHSSLIRYNGGKWNLSETDSIILDPGKTITVRTFGIIDTEVEDLNDSFDLIVNVMSSKGNNKYTYAINNTQR